MRSAKHFLVLLTALALIVPSFVTAQINFNGGRGLTYVQSAWSLDPGSLTLTTHSRLFGKNNNHSVFGSFTVWDISGRFHLNYGLTERLEVSIAPTVYQDTNRGDGISSPDDVYLSAKYGSLSSPGSSLTYGVQFQTRLPIGDRDNIPFEPYRANRVGFGFTGLLSYSQDPLYPEAATNFHANLGYWNHNDSGADLGATSMSQEFLYGFGVKVPREKFEFSAQLYGNVFVKSPPVAAYSRENYVYLSPGINYAPSSWLSLNFGFDLRLLDSKDKTLYLPNPGGASPVFEANQPNYSAWRINFGTKFDLRPSRSYRLDERQMLMKKAKSRRELFEEIIKEQKGTEAAQAELERIKEERIRAEKELERLRRILEGEAKEGTNGEADNKDKKGKN